MAKHNAGSARSTSKKQLDAVLQNLCSDLDASPTPFHACVRAGELLTAAGYVEVDERQDFPREPGRYFIVRGGSLVAWNSATGGDRFRIVGAHTDSPTLRIKPQPDLIRAGWQQLGVEVYGGPMFNSWLDRDLGLAGRVSLRKPRNSRRRKDSADQLTTELVNCAEPILRVSQLAIHLGREVNSEGLSLNAQQHLVPHWAFGAQVVDFRDWLGAQLDRDPADILSWDLMTYDLTPARRVGRDADLLASGRLDNLATTFAAVRALLDADAADDSANSPMRVIVLFDHEEVGSMSERGALSTLLPSILERIVLAAGGDRERYLATMARSIVASGDMAHATHPNYADKHEAQHQIAVNAGPVLKYNSNLRYATDSVGAAAFMLACEQADVPMQQFVMRSDLPCGSTVGPLTAAMTGATTVDFGAPMLSMHSARELAGALDQPMYSAALAAFLRPSAG